MTDYAAPPGNPGSFDDALTAMERLQEKKQEFHAIESRLRKLGGQLDTPEEYAAWCKLVYSLGSHPRRVCTRIKRTIADEQIHMGADAGWRAPQ